MYVILDGSGRGLGGVVGYVMRHPTLAETATETREIGMTSGLSGNEALETNDPWVWATNYLPLCVPVTWKWRVPPPPPGKKLVHSPECNPFNPLFLLRPFLLIQSNGCQDMPDNVNLLRLCTFPIWPAVNCWEFFVSLSNC